MVITARWALGVSLFFILGCLAVLWETRDIPPGTFEPLGSAPVPQATALLIIALSLAVAARSWRTLTGGERDPAPEIVDEARPLDAVVTGVLTVIYVAVLGAHVLDFAPLTALYLILTIGYLIRFRVRGLVLAALVAVIMGWGAAFVFTRLFVVDLPGL
ncbi:tripartite tricarboxylate transporter TctB family protein [Acuticoccus mangrovi]|uniref:Tripartite tricarboxylate transporter TctB family protein n=1 Tax=Acuticoccus mangrovi TaxID=2796142 RepID=A0A934IL48_9HYPH|nr:tripartite tricarboxylate transporter TctB family protein [Acuticoccus mangrovi]MBJ3774635.1 tripartite tricarboxylate transporter TctB family protein [Acuticoccus mangrovi]